MKKNIPVLFQTLDDVQISDTRFTKVKIWLMHLEENFNGSFFSEEAVTRAIPTLANTPIMGLIDKDSEDFTDHAIELDITLDDNGEVVGFKEAHLTVPFGVIPSDNKATFESRVGDDGVTRRYLTVEGLLWNKWEDAVNILNKNQGLAGQSMEITDVSGVFVEEGFFEIIDFKFDGACLLGKTVEPAMVNSTVELATSDLVADVIKEKLSVYTKFTTQKGGSSVDKEKIEEKVTEEEVNTEFAEDKKEEGKDVEAKDKAPAKKAAPKADNSDKDSDLEVKEENKLTDKKTVKTEPKKEEPKKEDKAEKSEEEDKSLMGQIIINGFTYDEEEVIKLLEIQDKYNTLIEDLRVEKINTLVDSYSSELSDDEIETLKSEAKDKEYEAIEQSIFAIIGRKSYEAKSKGSTDEIKNYTRVGVATKDKNDEPYGGIMNKK